MALIYILRFSRYYTKNIFEKAIITTQLREFSHKQKSSLEIDVDEDPDKPVAYLKSNAAKLSASQIRSGSSQSSPWYQPLVISLSLAVFMVYFFYLREENDIDLEFSKSLYDRISGLEEKNLEIVLEYNKNNKLPTRDIENRLEEIRRTK